MAHASDTTVLPFERIWQKFGELRKVQSAELQEKTDTQINVALSEKMRDYLFTLSILRVRDSYLKARLICRAFYCAQFVQGRK